MEGASQCDVVCYFHCRPSEGHCFVQSKPLGVSIGEREGESSPGATSAAESHWPQLTAGKCLEGRVSQRKTFFSGPVGRHRKSRHQIHPMTVTVPHLEHSGRGQGGIISHVSVNHQFIPLFLLL